MGDEGPASTAELRFLVSVQDTPHLDAALRHLQRTPTVLREGTIKPGA